MTQALSYPVYRTILPSSSSHHYLGQPHRQNH